MPPKPRWQVFAPAIAVLLIALLTSLWLAWTEKRSVDAQIEARFGVEAAALGGTIDNVMRAYEQILRAGVGMMRGSGDVTREEWRMFVQSLALDTTFPGIQGVGYVKVLAPAELAAFIASERAKGRDGFAVHPQSPRETYTAIVFLEPEDWRNQRAIGYDMFSEGVRREAMERARDTGQPSLSGHVTLVQETDTAIQAGALMYLPHYAGDDEPATAENRRARLQGYVYGAFRMQDLIERALQRQAPAALSEMRLQIYDGAEAEKQNLLFDSERGTHSAARHVPLQTRDVTLAVGGRTWLLRAKSLPEWEDKLDRSRPTLLLAGGSIAALLLSLIAASLAHQRDQSAISKLKLEAEVAERRAAQEQVALTNGELIHRVKNTLAVVSAIASQTARHSTTLDDFSAAFRDRIAGLSRVNDLLRAGSGQAVDLRQLIETVAAPYRLPGMQDAMVLTGPGVNIPANQAVLFSMMINELATNATKYGAWSMSGGKVGVDWSLITQEGGVPWLHLNWIETGGPEAAQPKQLGYGTNVMRFAVERSLGGRLDLNYQATGAAHKIAVPLNALDAQRSLS